MGLRAAQGLAEGRDRAAEYMRRTFAGDPAIECITRGEVIHGGAEERFGPRRLRRTVQENRGPRRRSADARSASGVGASEQAHALPPLGAPQDAAGHASPAEFPPVPATQGHSRPCGASRRLPPRRRSGARASPPPDAWRRHASREPAGPRVESSPPPGRSRAARAPAAARSPDPAPPLPGGSASASRARRRSRDGLGRRREDQRLREAEATTVFERPSDASAQRSHAMLPLPLPMLPPSAARTLTGPAESERPHSAASPAASAPCRRLRRAFARQAPAVFASGRRTAAVARHRRALASTTTLRRPRAIARSVTSVSALPQTPEQPQQVLARRGRRARSRRCRVLRSAAGPARSPSSSPGLDGKPLAKLADLRRRRPEVHRLPLQPRARQGHSRGQGGVGRLHRRKSRA